jgi:hypothetical protein
MREATEQLVRGHANEFSSGEILAAVARAKAQVRAHFAHLDVELPPTATYVALIESTARRDLLSQASGR